MEEMKKYLNRLIILLVLSLFFLSIHIQLAINFSVKKTAYHVVNRISRQIQEGHFSRKISSTNKTGSMDNYRNKLYTVMNSPAGHASYVGNNENCTDIKDKTNCFLSCPETSPKLVGRKTPYLSIPTTTKLKTALSWVKNGGRYSPDGCIPRHHVAVIIPFRDRDQHLKTFLYNIHPFLRRQQLDYGIYVIEQIGTSKFNRAMLMNIGYAESIKIHKYTCFVFHDVDLLPEDDRNSYSCTTQPRHLSAAVDKFKYRLPYKAIFGGASALSKSQLQSVNGFSNKFFGWGGEDDDMWNRLMHANFTVTRHSNKVARYTMLRHGKEKGNKHNTKRYKLLENGYKRFKKDGLNSLTYNVVRIQINPLYTRISVDINEKEIMKISKRRERQFS